MNNNPSEQPKGTPLDPRSVLATALQEVHKGNLGLALSMVANGLFPEIGAVVSEKIAKQNDELFRSREAINKIGALLATLQSKLGRSQINPVSIFQPLNQILDAIAAAAILANQEPGAGVGVSARGIDVQAVAAEAQRTAIDASAKDRIDADDRQRRADSDSVIRAATGIIAGSIDQQDPTAKTSDGWVPLVGAGIISGAMSSQYYNGNLSGALSSGPIVMPTTAKDFAELDRQADLINKENNTKFVVAETQADGSTVSKEVGYSDMQMMNFLNPPSQLSGQLPAGIIETPNSTMPNVPGVTTDYTHRDEMGNSFTIATVPASSETVNISTDKVPNEPVLGSNSSTQMDRGGKSSVLKNMNLSSQSNVTPQSIDTSFASMNTSGLNSNFSIPNNIGSPPAFAASASFQSVDPPSSQPLNGSGENPSVNFENGSNTATNSSASSGPQNNVTLNLAGTNLRVNSDNGSNTATHSNLSSETTNTFSDLVINNFQDRPTRRSGPVQKKQFAFTYG